MKRSLLVAASVLAAALCCLPRLSAQEGKDAIVSGERIGQVHLGMSDEAVEKLLGKPTASDAAMGRGVNTWIAKSTDGRTEQTQVVAHRDEDGRHWKVTQVAVTSAFFRTRGGNSTSSDLDAIWREFPDLRYVAAQDGPGSALEFYDSTTSGAAFLIEHAKHPGQGEPWGKCRAIIVHPAGEQVSPVAIGTPLEHPPGS